MSDPISTSSGEANRPQYSSFTNRWKITGTLRTLSPLHIGDGFASEDRIPPVEDKERMVKTPRLVQTVCRNANGVPFIPASALKGALRALFERQSDDAELKKALFGNTDFGGALFFWDAPLILPKTPISAPDLPSFRRNNTDVSVSVSIDRKTRTAVENHLFHIEYVPAGAEFAIELTGQNITEPKAIPILLGLLAHFNNGILTLGAHQVHGWGRMEWVPGIHCICEKRDVIQWLEDEQEAAGARTASFAVSREVQVEPILMSPASKRLVFQLTLDFHSPLLVRDPAKSKHQDDPSVDKEDPSRPPDAQPLLSQSGIPMIPSRAVRGVLRSRAEMILRTLGHDIPPPNKAKIIGNQKDLPGLDPASCIFGAPGWRAPLEISDFHLVEGCTVGELRQEFVALDRFTGGGAKGKKFNALAVTGTDGKPLSLNGTVTLNIDRLQHVESQEWAPGLLALVFRDLFEGDLTFGSGAAKGYGACMASGLVRVKSAEPFQDIQAWLAEPATVNARVSLCDLPKHRHDRQLVS